MVVKGSGKRASFSKHMQTACLRFFRNQSIPFSLRVQVIYKKKNTHINRLVDGVSTGVADELSARVDLRELRLFPRINEFQVFRN